MPLESATPVSQKTIAKHLGVSIATVSKALSHKSDISEAMRLKVEQSARELGYKARSSSLELQRQRRSTKFIGVFMRRPLDGGGKDAPTYLDGMNDFSSELNVSLVVQDWKKGSDPATLIDPNHQPAAMKEGLLSGILLGGEWPAEIVNKISRKHETVMFPHGPIDCDVDVVGIDNVVSMLQVVSRLRKLGHTKIGFLGRCPMMWASERFAGYFGALDRLGLPYRQDWVIDIDKTPMLSVGHEDYWQLKVDRIEAIRKEEGVEAWVCSSDWPAYQLYRGMLDRGYEVPRDLSITGFDDTEQVRLGCPCVTSVKVPYERIGEAALKRLVHRIENPGLPVQHSQFACQPMAHATNGPPSYAKAKKPETSAA